jgi:hypothetical protein
MAGLRDYSTTAGANTALFPEGMAPSAVNDGMRQVQADIRAWYEDAQWIDLGHVPAYAGATSFTLAGDRTATYHVGRRVRAIGTAPFTLYGSVTGSSFASETTVVVAWDSGALDNSLAHVAVGAASAIDPALPQATATARGAIELADAAEVAAGTDAERAATPATLAAAVAYQGRQTVWIPASAMITRLTGGAAMGTTETATNRVMRRTLDFGADTAQFAQFLLAMPKSWNEGTIALEFLWTAASGSGGVVWAAQAVALSDDDGFEVAFGAAQQVSDTLLAAGDLHRSAETGAITIGGSPAEGDLVIVQIQRIATDAADTLAAVAQLIGVRLFYQTNARNDA